jgi:hypothetical protein
MGISAVRGASYTQPAPKAQRMDTQQALALHQQSRPNAAERRGATNHVSSTEQRRGPAPQKDKGSRVDVRV